MCVCISQTCLTLNKRFQTETELVVCVSYVESLSSSRRRGTESTWYARFRAPQAVPSRGCSSGEVTDIGGGRKTRGVSARRDHVARVVPRSVAAHLHGAACPRLARCRVDAVAAVGVRSPPSAKASRLAGHLPRGASMAAPSELAHSFGDCVPVRHFCHRRQMQCASRGVRGA